MVDIYLVFERHQLDYKYSSEFKAGNHHLDYHVYKKLFTSFEEAYLYAQPAEKYYIHKESIDLGTISKDQKCS